MVGKQSHEDGAIGATATSAPELFNFNGILFRFYEKAATFKRVFLLILHFQPCGRVAAMLPFALFVGHCVGPVHDAFRSAGAAICGPTSLRV